MNRAVVTIACGTFYERVAQLTHPIMEAYAKKLNADFIVWSDHQGHSLPHYKKLELGCLLENYDRVLYIDTDVLIRDDAPDIFAITPDDRLGLFEEGKYFRDRTIQAIRVMDMFGYDPLLWDGKYYNTGVMVLSRIHRTIFVQPPIEVDSYKEQTYLNMMISATKTKVFSLPYRFNRFCNMDRYYGEVRFDSYFMHYGGASLVASEEQLLSVLAKDLEAWRRAAPSYDFRKYIALIVKGPLSEHLAAEPAIRYASEVVYRGDCVVVITDRPELYRHLKMPVYTNVEQVPDIEHFQRRDLHDNRAALQSAGISTELVHGVSFAALSLLGMQLPTDHSTPVLRVDEDALGTVRQKVHPAKPEQLVLVHPSCQRSADFIPPVAWQSYVDALVERGHRVALVGNLCENECPVITLNTAHCVDLVGQLTLAELIALISRAPVLIATDSDAIHVAGAFENWICLIAPSRHAELVLNWRRGSQFWRARSLERADADALLTRERLPMAQSVVQLVDHAIADFSSASQNASQAQRASPPRQ